MGRKYSLGEIPHPEWPWLRERAREVNVCVDIGPGIRPQSFVKCKTHICIEPHYEYQDILKDEYPVICGTALDCIDLVKGVDTFVALDVIEHMTKSDGLTVIEKMVEKAREQVIIFTPLGFMHQSHPDGIDNWGFNGAFWQEHRSGWVPDEFHGWDIHLWGGGFIAVHG